LLNPGLALPSQSARRQYVIGLAILVVLAVGGLYLVKWNPYYHKAFLAAANHSLGASIVSGTARSAPGPSMASAVSYLIAYFNAIWQALVLGLLLATTIETLLPRDWLARLLGKRAFQTTALGGVIALPGMMCTCCASPVVVGLRKNGVSVGAALAFWLGSPTLNPATLIFMVFALSWKWALLRVIVGVVLVFGVSYLASRLFPEEQISAAEIANLTPPPGAPTSTIVARWFQNLGRLMIGLLPEYLVIVLLLGAARAWLFPAASLAAGNAFVWIVLLAIAGTLFVVPTAGEIPIVQTMLGYGLGAGPAGALLLTLAPLSLPSVAMVWSVFPRRVLAFTIASLVILGILGGLVALGLGFS